METNSVSTFTWFSKELKTSSSVNENTYLVTENTSHIGPKSILVTQTIVAGGSPASLVVSPRPVLHHTTKDKPSSPV